MSKHSNDDKLSLAFALHGKGNIDEAAKLYRAVIRRNPKSGRALHWLGAIEASNGNLAEAARLMERSLSIQPSNKQFAENYATVLCQLGNFGGASAICLKSLATNNTSTYLLYVGAGALLKLNRLQESLSLFDRLLAQEPDHIAAITERSSVLLEMKEYEGASSGIDRALTLNPQYSYAHLNKGVLCGELGRYDEAIAAFDKALALNPSSGGAWAGRGNALVGLERYDEARIAYENALKAEPGSSEARLGLGNVCLSLKQFNNAFAFYSEVLEVEPELVEAWLGRGNALSQLKRYEQAVAAYERASALKPELASAWLGHANVVLELRRFEEALGSYDRALAIKPELAEAWFGRGNACLQLKRHEEALSSYEKTLTHKPALAEAWRGRGDVYFELMRYEEALASYKKAVALEPDLASAWLGCANVVLGLRRSEEALGSYERALAIKPELAEAWFGRGNACLQLKRHEEALSSFQKALTHNPTLAEAWCCVGNLFVELKRYNEAIEAYGQALRLKPDLRGVEGARLNTKMILCDWINLDAECSSLTSAVKNGKPNTGPFNFLTVSSSAEDQLQCAALWVAENFPQKQKGILQGKRSRHEKIRVAYVSADLREHHPVSFLIAGMLEAHDKSRFDVTAISLGVDDSSQMRRRLRSSVDHFIDADTFDDNEIINLIRASEIDILVDLMGFTAGSRTRVFADRPAPIQINYLGYPGTMGAQYIDYIVSDRLVIPDEMRECYSEKIVYLPDSFMASDSKRKISERLWFRTECNLPEDGFVFCSFNRTYKIVPQVFDIWMKVLQQLDNSVLWLSGANETAIRNLRREAQFRGVDPSRLVFAQQVPLNEDHLARHRLADLFLDTLLYNAHTTASDALWAGLPVLTCLGQTFAGRVGASLLNALDLPELIATTPEMYEQMAIDFATYPEKLAAIKSKLAVNLRVAPLFDTKRFTKNIEAAYVEMVQRHQVGLAPDHIVVS
jgi:protein O-GlcNAc transferase